MDEVLPPTAALMSSIYEEHKGMSCLGFIRLIRSFANLYIDEDGFLYITYSGENTFGFEELA